MKNYVGLLLAFVGLVSCNQKNSEELTSTQPVAQEQMMATPGNVQVGDIVPNDLVCMVNNDYMGTEQLEVEVNGKTYYGCCEMCQERLPVDESVRVAIDPISQKQVDKADAVIAVTGIRGEVSYFENEENYHKFVKTVLKKEEI